MAGGEELHIEVGLQGYFRRESCLSSPLLDVWSQEMGRREAWGGVSRDQGAVEMGICVGRNRRVSSLWMLVVRVAVVCSRDGVGMDGWMVDEQAKTGNKGGK